MRRKKIQLETGQESVWDYPRPPGIEVFTGHIRILFNSEIIVDVNRAYRVLETSHPPTYYLPVNQFKKGIFYPNPHTSFCEFKGRAGYYNIIVSDKKALRAAWHYPDPNLNFRAIKDHVSIYAHLMDACYINDELVKAQEGNFYGGWITSNVVGPFKGGDGTIGW